MNLGGWKKAKNLFLKPVLAGLLAADDSPVVKAAPVDESLAPVGSWPEEAPEDELPDEACCCSCNRWLSICCWMLAGT